MSIIPTLSKCVQKFEPAIITSLANLTAHPALLTFCGMSLIISYMFSTMDLV